MPTANVIASDTFRTVVVGFVCCILAVRVAGADPYITTMNNGGMMKRYLSRSYYDNV